MADWLAIAITAFLVWWPLFMAPDSVLQRIIGGTHVTDWLLVAVGVGQLIILRVQAGIYDGQRILMHGQLTATQRAADAAIAAQRPWVKVKDITLDTPITVNSGGQVAIHATIVTENIGKTPALRVFVQAAVCFDLRTIEATALSLEDVVIQTQSRAGRAIIFPDETFDLHTSIWTRLPQNPRAALTLLVGIVSYQFGRDIGTTTFAYRLVHRALGGEFVRAIHLGQIDLAAQEDIVIERMRMTGNDAT